MTIVGPADMVDADYKVYGTTRRWGISRNALRAQVDTLSGTSGKFGLATNYQEPFGTNNVIGENGVKFKYRFVR